MIVPAFITFSLFVAFASALNDWSKPCFDGTCQYDVKGPDDTVAATVKIWGSADAVSDVTTAAGWTIIGCDENALIQDIRLVCTSTDTLTCNHLFRNFGFGGKIVRLPENCGRNAFARVAKAWVSEDQTLPDHIASEFSRRPEAPPKVQALKLDTDFAAIDPTHAGNVSIAITGTNIPGVMGDAVIPAAAFGRRAGIQKRGLFGWIEDQFDQFNNYDKTLTTDLPPIDINKSYNIFNEQITCSATTPVPVSFRAGISADVAANAHLVVTLGIAAAGTIVPPKLDALAVFAALNGQLDASLKLVGTATGTVDTGPITLYQVGIPGLDIAGLLTIGPTFKVIAQAKANLDINVDASVDLVYTIEDAKLFFPESANHESGGVFKPGNSPLKLSVTPSVDSHATVEAHVIPRLDIGINALGGIAKATVYLSVDGSATANLSLDADANAGVIISPGTPTNTSASGTVTGCVDINAGLHINAGADASFFGLFDESIVVPLYNQDFDLYAKCWSASTKRGAFDDTIEARNEKLWARGLQCSTSGLGLVSLANEVIPASSIKAIA